jgi:hypothetical protein
MEIPRSHYIINVSHLKNNSCLNCNKDIWNLLSRSRVEDDWNNQREDIIAQIVSFLKSYYCQIVIIKRKQAKVVMEEL